MTQRELREQRVSVGRQTLKGSDTSSVVEHTMVYDTIHVVCNETIWREPDSVGKIYPLKTVVRESGGQRKILTERVEQKRDTIYVSTNQMQSTNTQSDIRAPTNGWVPWVIIIGMVIVSIIIIAIRIFLIKT